MYERSYQGYNGVSTRILLRVKNIFLKIELAIMASGIVLAGGLSKRAHDNKMHFLLENKPLLMHTIESIKPFVNKVILVTGHYDQDIRSFVKEDEKISIVYNSNYEKGMFSSVLTGVKEVDDDLFILPGDIPFISKETYEALLNGTKPLRCPTYKGKEGHPLFIKKEIRKELLKEPIDSNLKAFRDRYDLERIPVNDKYILKDIDTIEEYQELVKERK